MSITPLPEASAVSTASQPIASRTRAVDSAGGRTSTRTPSIAPAPAPAETASRRPSVASGNASARLARVWRR